jgi:hypothetical protein
VARDVRSIVNSYLAAELCIHSFPTEDDARMYRLESGSETDVVHRHRRSSSFEVPPLLSPSLIRQFGRFKSD